MRMRDNKQTFRIGDLVMYTGRANCCLAVVYGVDDKNNLIGFMFADSDEIDWFYKGMASDYFQNLTYKETNDQALQAT